MATERKFRRGTAAEHAQFTGANGEVTVVSDLNTLRVHDGVTVGGHGVVGNKALGKLVGKNYVGNISAYVGYSLQEQHKDNVYEYPDNSGYWYGVVSGATYPITIPADPGADDGWELVSVLTSTGDGSALSVLAQGGTTPRTLVERFSDVVNVKDFGAVGDGVADDTVAIKMAIAHAKLNGMNIEFSRADKYYRLTETIEIGHKCICEGNLALLSIEHSTGNGIELGTAIQFRNFGIVVRDDDFTGWALNVDVSDIPNGERHYPSQLHVNNIYLDSDTQTYNANMVRFAPAANYGAKMSRIFFGRGIQGTYTRRCNNGFLWEASDSDWNTSCVVSEVYMDMFIQGDMWRMENLSGLGFATTNEMHSIVLQTYEDVNPAPWGYIFYCDGFQSLKVSNFKVFDYVGGSQYAKPIYFKNMTAPSFSMSDDINFLKAESDLIEVGENIFIYKPSYSSYAGLSNIQNNPIVFNTSDKTSGFAYPYLIPNSTDVPFNVEITSRQDFTFSTRPLIAKIKGWGKKFQQILTYDCAYSTAESNVNHPIHKLKLCEEGVVVWIKPSYCYLQYSGSGKIRDVDGAALHDRTGSPITVAAEAYTAGLGGTTTTVVSYDEITSVP